MSPSRPPRLIRNDDVAEVARRFRVAPDPVTPFEDEWTRETLRSLWYAAGYARQVTWRQTLERIAGRIARPHMQKGRPRKTRPLDVLQLQLYRDLLAALKSGDPARATTYIDARSSVIDRQQRPDDVPYAPWWPHTLVAWWLPPVEHRLARERAEHRSAGPGRPTLSERAARWALDVITSQKHHELAVARLGRSQEDITRAQDALNRHGPTEDVLLAMLAVTGDPVARRKALARIRQRRSRAKKRDKKTR